MLLDILMLVFGLGLSAVAAWFSLTGMIAIFPAYPIAIIVFVGVLEAAKLINTSWLYNNWQAAPWRLKAPLSLAVVILMVITSMGTFGYLSKAHLSVQNAGAETSLKLERTTQEITIKELQLNRLSQTEDRLNTAIDKLISSDKVEVALQQRRRLQKELNAVAKEKKALQTEIDALYQDKMPLELENKKNETEIGPLKYIAELIYGEENAKSHFDQAVRMVIILLVSVFDPLAVFMLLAANFSFKRRRELAAAIPPLEALTTEEPTSVEEPKQQEPVLETESDPEPEPEPEPVENLTWDTEEKTWRNVNWQQDVANRIRTIAPGYVSIDGVPHSEVSLRNSPSISLERVKFLIEKLAADDMSVDDLSWIECDAIKKYLENDKPSNVS